MFGNVFLKFLKCFNRRNGRHGDWFHTHTGVQFYPLDPRASEIVLEDIAQSLSNQCRFAGHVNQHYSIGEHSVRGSYYMDTIEDAFAFLFHDASETYLVDVPRPIKRTGLLGWLYRLYEAQLERELAKVFGLRGLSRETRMRIKDVDSRMLMTERRDLKTDPPAKWRETSAPFPDVIVPWTPEETKARFLARFDELTNRELYT